MLNFNIGTCIGCAGLVFTVVVVVIGGNEDFTGNLGSIGMVDIRAFEGAMYDIGLNLGLILLVLNTVSSSPL